MLVLHILIRPRLSYSGQISPNRIILATNSVDATEPTTPAATVNVYAFYLYFAAYNYARSYAISELFG